MPITAKLSHTLYQAFGDEVAGEMIDWMQRMDAQRSDFREMHELTTARFESRLAELDAKMQARFAEVDTRFAQVDKRFAEIDGWFKEVDARFDQVDARFDQVDAGFGQVDAGFGQVAARFGQMEKAMELGFARLETKIEQRTSDLIKWSFGFWVGSVVTVMVALVALTRFLR